MLLCSRSSTARHFARLRGFMSASSPSASRGFEHALSSPDEPHNLRVRTGAEASASAGDGGPGLPRSQSLGSFLDLRDVNITEDGEGSVGGARAAPRCDTGQGPVVTPRAAPCIALPKQNRETLRHFAIDIGGSLIKLVYFSPDSEAGDASPGLPPSGLAQSGGRLHFLKFETSNVDECIRFIEAKGLHLCSSRHNGLACVKATGGGAFRFNELFETRLGLTLEKEDELASLVSGANFLLQELHDEAFSFAKGHRTYLPHLADSDDLFPYLLVNIGSGVSILHVTQHGHERVSGTNMGGGTFWGLCRLLTGCKDFDEMLELSARGDNANTDMLVGDIYGGNDYSKALGLSATTIASSFGKVVMEIDKEPGSYRPEDLALSLLRMISYNIAHIAVLNAMRLGLKRIFFGGFFIRGHPYTMDTISFAINFWSKGEMSALFLRHEGFLGALGAFLRHYDEPNSALVSRKGSWIERFLKTAGGESGAPADAAATAEAEADARPVAGLQVGVLHLVPSLEGFPLLLEGASYAPDTLDLVSDPEERAYWLTLLAEHTPSLVDKAVLSAGSKAAARELGAAFHSTFTSMLARIAADPDAYGQLSLASVFEMREEALRSYGFRDAFKAVKDAENAAALLVLRDLLDELDALPAAQQPLALIEGCLAGNLFDWGSRACVELYQTGTIMEMYRQARSSLSRPFGIDDFDDFAARLAVPGRPYARALLFCDNSGADVVLGMLPLARYLLSRGCDVLLVANSLPALNDITVGELADVLRQAAAVDGTLRGALEAAASAGSPGACTSPAQGACARLWAISNGHGSPCLDLRRVSRELCAAAVGADLVVLEGMGRSVHTNLWARFACDVLKIAMIKNARLAHKIFGGALYDCVCRFERAPAPE